MSNDYSYLILTHQLPKGNYINQHHHHRQTDNTDFPDSFSPSIAPGRSSGLHPVSAQSWCMWVFANITESVKVRPSFFSSAPHVLFVFLAWFVRWEVGSRTDAFGKCCFQDFFQDIIQHSCIVTINLFSPVFHKRLCGTSI